MAYFIQQLVNGITLGSIYGLIAIGYTMVYGIIGMINFAHGEIYMIGAFLSILAFTMLGVTGVTWMPLALIMVLLRSHWKNIPRVVRWMQCVNRLKQKNGQRRKL